MVGSDATGKPRSTAAAWAAAAEALADWAWASLVNRADAWGRYGGRGPWTAKGQLDPGMLARHFRARGRADVIGLHSTSAANTSQWGAVDIDWHGPTSTAPAANLRAALTWYALLAQRGHRPLLTSSNGLGGYHLRVLLAGPAATPRVYHYLRQLVADHRAHGMAAPPETCPKQPAIPPGGWGNWLRLPGRHHSREHWSRVWDGSRWLEGAEAIEHILSLTGDPVQLLPEAPPPQPPRPPRRVYTAPAGDNLSACIARYMRRLPNGGEGTGRDDTAYQFAAWLVRDMALADDIALAWLERWDAGNSPPKGEARLKEILADAHRYGRRAYGCGRPPAAPRRDRNGHVILSTTVEVRV
jgi:hypothetical protein